MSMQYCALKFGPEGTGYLRLDGETNRIKREMEIRAFNAAGSAIPIYLISTRAGGMVKQIIFFVRSENVIGTCF